MKVEINNKLHFKKITPDAGMVLTEWTEDKKITEYSSSTLMYCPMTYDEKVLREITEAEDADLKERKEVAVKEEFDKIMNERSLK